MQAKRDNAGKPDLHYLDPWYDALCEVAQVCMEGEKKYDRGNYLRGQPHSELLAAARRHTMKFGSFRYPDYDDESSCHHIAHAIWNLLQLLQNDLMGDCEDDRLAPPEPAEDDDYDDCMWSTPLAKMVRADIEHAKLSALYAASTGPSSIAHAKLSAWYAASAGCHDGKIEQEHAKLSASYAASPPYSIEGASGSTWPYNPDGDLPPASASDEEDELSSCGG